MVLVGGNQVAERYLIPFVVYGLFISSTFSITGIDVFTVLIYGVFLVNWFAGRLRSGVPRGIFVAFLLYPGVLLLSLMVNGLWGDLVPTLKENYRLLLPFALFPLLQFVQLRRLLGVFAVMIGLMAVYGYLQYLWGVDWLRPEGKELQEVIRFSKGDQVFRAKGNYSVSLTYAGVMLIVSPVFFSLALDDTKKSSRWGWGVAALAAIWATLLSFARSGWIGIGFAYALFALHMKRRWAGSILLVLLVGVITVGVLGYTGKLKVWFYHKDAPSIVKRVLTTSAWTDRERLYLWESGLLAISDKPLLGHGAQSKKKLEPYRAIVSKRHKNYEFRVGAILHQIYLQVAFNAGLLGLAAYLYMWWRMLFWIIQSFRRARRERKKEKGLLLGIGAGMTGSMVAGFFENNFLDGEVQILILMIFSIGLHVGRGIREEPEKAVI